MPLIAMSTGMTVVAMANCVSRREAIKAKPLVPDRSLVPSAANAGHLPSQCASLLEAHLAGVELFFLGDVGVVVDDDEV